MSAPAPARAQGPDPERAQISEIRAAFFELVDGRPLDALAVRALHARELLEGGARREIGKQAAVVVTRRAILEHR